MAPIVQQAPSTAAAVIEIYSSFTRQFNLGKGAEDALDQMAQLAQQAASQPQPNPAAEQMKAEMAMKEREFEMKQAGAQQKLETDRMKAEMDIFGKKLDMALKQREFGMDMQRMEREAEVDMAKAGVAIQTLQVKADMAQKEQN
jgi:hypothetical protein